MPWPFGRKKAPPPPSTRPQAPRADDADERLAVLILEWLGANAPVAAVRPDEAHTVHLGGAPDKSAPAGAVLRVTRGKLAWVDLYDPDLRPIVNALITRLDKDQLWSFNGVVATKYEETKGGVA